MGRLKEDGALAYAELFTRCCAVAQTWREFSGGEGFGGYVVDARVM